jgi:hypothetical protein
MICELADVTLQQDVHTVEAAMRLYLKQIKDPPYCRDKHIPVANETLILDADRIRLTDMAVLSYSRLE